MFSGKAGARPYVSFRFSQVLNEIPNSDADSYLLDPGGAGDYSSCWLRVHGFRAGA
ncbi:protein of unknown function [Thauera humireducens]|nr:protein of unknown function [Thauera humireducens]